MVFSATQQYFSYIVAVNLLVEETGENHRPVGSDWPALSNSTKIGTTEKVQCPPIAMIWRHVFQ
jgi:hypothetical protein